MTRFTPLWEQAGQYAASVDRRLIAAAFPWGAFVIGAAVSVASGMTVNIAAGTIVVPTANNTGAVLCSSDAVEQVTLAAAPASGTNRYDLVICQARGNDLDGGANNDWLFTTVTGTAAASPTVPAVPANAVAVAQVYVPGGSASITAGNITDRRWLWVPGQRVAGVVRGSDFGFSGTGETDAAMTLGPLYVPAGRKLQLVLSWGSVNGNVTSDMCVLRIKEGATKLHEARVSYGSSAFFGNGATIATTIAPAAGQHSYSIAGAGNAANNYNVTSNANQPFSFDIFDVGTT